MVCNYGQGAQVNMQHDVDAVRARLKALTKIADVCLCLRQRLLTRCRFVTFGRIRMIMRLRQCPMFLGATSECLSATGRRWRSLRSLTRNSNLLPIDVNAAVEKVKRYTAGRESQCYSPYRTVDEFQRELSRMAIGPVLTRLNGEKLSHLRSGGHFVGPCKLHDRIRFPILI